MPKILCVDDDRAGLATVARVLRQVGEVEVAASAAEARHALGPAIGVVVSDHRMPGVSGAAFLADVRVHDDTIGRILLTAYADAEILMEAINAGHVHRYLAKPWDPRELRAAVRHALAASDAERERRRLAAEIATAYERLRELDVMKGRFLTLAAHELRTPLHVLSATLEALHESTGDVALELLDGAGRALDWLGRSVRAITDVARLSAPVPRPRTTLCLAVIAHGAVAAVAPFCATRRLALTCELPAAAPVRGNAEDLHHALTNLLLNAIRFTPDGGRIAVTLRADGERVALAVSDTGVGIAAALRPRLGEPFVTGGALEHHHSDPIAFQSGGMGLGLAVARAIASEHEGRLWFESDEGRGSTFHLELPIARDSVETEGDATRATRR